MHRQVAKLDDGSNIDYLVPVLDFFAKNCQAVVLDCS